MTMSVSLTNLLDLLEVYSSEALSSADVRVEDASDSFTFQDIKSSSSNVWTRIDSVVSVVFDMKGSTDFGLNKHSISTARIYDAAISGAVRILSNFEADFIDIQGDGGFGLFWGDNAMERAICSGITIKTFSLSISERLANKWPKAPLTGLKVGMHIDHALVKKIGTPRNPDEQEPVWAGRAVNYAFKCAQAADTHQMIVTQKVWERVRRNDYIAFTCNCEGTPSAGIWNEVAVEKLPEKDRKAMLLTSQWCENCGPSFCDSVMSGDTHRDEIEQAERGVLDQKLRARALEVRQSRGHTGP